MKKLIHGHISMLLGQQASAALRSGWFWAFRDHPFTQFGRCFEYVHQNQSLKN